MVIYMRLRNVKNKEEILSNSSYFISNGEEYIGKWSELFGNNNPIYIEIGMGKGKFILENAIKYPDINFIGIEKYDSVIAKCLPKIPDGLNNLVILRLDALNIDKVFLAKYDSIFKNNMEICMRTDNRDLFVYSLLSFSEYGYTLRKLSLDLHSEEIDNLITTEYEDKFSDKGMPIYAVVVDKSDV